MVFHNDWLLHDVLEHLFAILLVVRWVATKHLIQKCTQTPPVNTLVMPNALNDLRRQILRRAAKRLGFVTLLRIDPLFRETEIRDFQISLIVKQNIFWFQIAIDNIVLMQTPNSLDHLS